MFFPAPGAITRMELVRYLSHFTTQSKRSLAKRHLSEGKIHLRCRALRLYYLHAVDFSPSLNSLCYPGGSSEHCTLDKFSLFSKAFLSISSAPLWQVERKRAKFWGQAVFPALRCQEMSKRSFFTSKKIDRFGLVTQPDQASVPRGSEYK